VSDNCLSAKGCSSVVSLVCHFILHICLVMMKVKNQDTLCNLDVSSCVLIVFIFHLHLKIILLSASVWQEHFTETFLFFVLHFKLYNLLFSH